MFSGGREKVHWERMDFRRKLRIWSHLLKKSLMENFIFCAVISMTQLIHVSESFFSRKKNGGVWARDKKISIKQWFMFPILSKISFSQLIYKCPTEVFVHQKQTLFMFLLFSESYSIHLLSMSMVGFLSAWVVAWDEIFGIYVSKTV